MNSKVWLILSSILLISTHLQADDSGYGNRQFTFNPGNGMGDMFNPMRNFFGGSNRYSDDYYNHPYAPPTAYPPGYGYPGAAYGYPPVNPAYPPQPQVGGYPSFPPVQQPQAPTTDKKGSQTPPPAYSHPTSNQPVYGEQYRFRPLESSEPAAIERPRDSATERAEYASPPVQQQAPAPISYPSSQPQAEQASIPRSSHAMEQSYSPAIEPTAGTQQGQMKFRPLDQPGYSE
ncbi:hypothetical protein [Candidatus Thiodiazotropha sp. CDECU1]|uniref:hypothetical protein n=1 Tax=Candidatus Thiodiazotropha sp. CDECU1 TaxID=3065865 RepID=UPI00292CC30A|nr:hypothetical protein [Candidatus Thiodiazotropha sp. CDECU1]